MPLGVQGVKRGWRERALDVMLAAALAVLAGPARGDGILDVWPNSTPPFSTEKYFFPNWVRAPASAWMLYECDDVTCAGCTNGPLVGLTMLNYGTAIGGASGDITGMYFNMLCAKYQSATFTMAYAGVWAIGAGNYPAWTWAGSEPFGVETCDTAKGCWCYPALYTYIDIGSCPTDGATIELGPGFNDILNPATPGGVTDGCGYTGPSGAYKDQVKYITYARKSVNLDQVAPGDVLTYTVFYGLPGTGNVSNVRITDTLPQYTHWNGGATPAPDAGWNPDLGPPMRLRWTIPGPIPTAGGATQAVTFQVTVDWGNMDWFEPGSGDIAAPENEFLWNKAHMSWESGSCSTSGKGVSNAPSTVVKRYLFYMLGDNDVLFAPRVGLPDDEIIYDIFLKNVSSSKTWWRVSIWDTVPPELDVWKPGLGLYDPCVGWTMTPTGCSPAGAGVVLSGGKTILTWQVDMPPAVTLGLRWKARVAPAAAPDTTATNVLSVMELGKTEIIGGTGHQGRSTFFVHVAPIVLRTTYISYVGIGGDGMGKRGVFLTFYPLNKINDFELRALEYQVGDPWPIGGGKSATIAPFIGSCTGGFPGGTSGCKAERAPAYYARWTGGIPSGYNYGDCVGATISPANPCSLVPDDGYHFLYKLVSNSPVLWQVFTCTAGKAWTFTPSTSLSYSGFIHYTFRRSDVDMITIMNTSVGPTDVLDPDLTTTLFFFGWDPGAYSWRFLEKREVDKESVYYMAHSPMCNAHYKIVSSQTKLVIRQSFQCDIGSGGNLCMCMSPTRNSGILVTDSVGEAFYVFPGAREGYYNNQVAVTNMGAGAATYRIEKYVPYDTSNPPPNVPPWLSSNSGKWLYVMDDSVPAGFFNAKNGHIYGLMYDFSYIFSEAPDDTQGVWRLILTSGGPIEVAAGGQIFSVYGGGSLLHANDGGGAQVGTDFWLTQTWSWIMGGHCDAPHSQMIGLDVFCPKTGTVVRALSEFGGAVQIDHTYTTDGIDQCVGFFRWTDIAEGTKRNIRIMVSAGQALVNFNFCQPSHKFFTAPFLQTGVHYDILPPPTVFIGQKFWLTVVVVEAAGGTKADYAGTTAFTSTDPGAKIAGGGMASYNYTWVPATDQGVKIFVEVIFNRLGLQVLVASDITDGSITGLAAIMVVGADVKLVKDPPFMAAASGDTVRFRVCWSNYSTASANQFVITDGVPVGTTYVPDAASAMDCGNTRGVAVTSAYSTSTSTTPPATFSDTGAGSPPPGARWLRWTVPQVGVLTTGCVCYRVRID